MPRSRCTPRTAAGTYPPTLDLLTPNYLKVLRRCPQARRDTYSPGYERSTSPDAYTIVCAGANHAEQGAAANFPQYSSHMTEPRWR